jgi:catechol 2,3-dioxygenase-like lactoylglutathione lyase family enzyme
MTVADAVADRLAPGYGSRMTATLDELTLAGAPDAWRASGFRVDGDTCVVGDTRIRLVVGGAGRGLSGWSLRNIESTELDGLPTTRSERPPPDEEPAHPNGVTGLDHVVAITPNLDRTVAALRGAGLDLRRIREEPTPAGAPRQAFFRLGAVILEVVQEPEEAIERAGGDRDRPAFFWGLALIAPGLDRTVASLGDRVGEIRDAVQPGRRIATLRRSAGLSVPIALITPPSAPRG